MNTKIDVAIVGAGPYGLSLGAYLNAAGVEHRVFGPPMEAWRSHMPPGMFLKSTGESSNLFDPRSKFTLEDFSREKGLGYHRSRLPVKLETFIAYGRAFQQRYVPRVEPKQLVALRAADGGYELSFDDGETVTARRVVLAIGVVPFRHTPSRFARFARRARFARQRLRAARRPRRTGGDSRWRRIFGARPGGVAFDAGRRGDARLAQPAGYFLRSPRSRPVAAPQLLSPPSGLGGGWRLRICADAPQLIHLLPDRLRLALLNNTLGPAAGYFVRDQVEANVTLKLGRAIERAEERGGRVRIETVGADGARETVESDHVIAATGYRVDVRRLGFIDEGVFRKIPHGRLYAGPLREFREFSARSPLRRTGFGSKFRSGHALRRRRRPSRAAARSVAAEVSAAPGGLDLRPAS